MGNADGLDRQLRLPREGDNNGKQRQSLQHLNAPRHTYVSIQRRTSRSNPSRGRSRLNLGALQVGVKQKDLESHWWVTMINRQPVGKMFRRGGGIAGLSFAWVVWPELVVGLIVADPRLVSAFEIFV